MHTDDLIRLLAADAGPVPRAAAARRLLPAIAAGLLASAALALWLIGPVDAPMLRAPPMALKLGYGTLVAVCAGWWAARLARPAAPATAAAGALAAVFAVIAAAGVAALATTPPEQRLADLLGHSWRLCPLSLIALSLPALAACLWALRGLAPTRPVLAGLAAGLLAGGLGTLGYSLACTEQATSFVAAWYTAGIALTGALGAVLGPRTLRW